MAGYVRNDTANNITDGNIINSADLDGEFDAIVAAFVNTTGHTHDGTAAEGAPITKMGPAQDLVVGIAAVTPKTDNTLDLGSSLLEFKDLYIDGTANIDSLVADTADINAGTIDGVTIGGSSAAAGTFTTATATTGNITTVNATTVDTTNLEVTNVKAKDGTSAATIADSTGVVSFTANPVFSAGTANGVLYLDGSKVATSGSALTFDGTNLGVGATAVYGGLYGTIHAYSASGATIRLDRNGAGTSTIQSVQTGVAYRDLTLDAANNIFSINSTEQMRLTSTGLGIGTSSPGAKLEIANAATGIPTLRLSGFNGADNSQFGVIQFYNEDASQQGPNVAASIKAITAANTDGSGGQLTFATSTGTGSEGSEAVERMRLDSSGNLGIGTTSAQGRLDVAIPTLSNTISAIFKANDGVWNTYLAIQHSTSGITISNGNSNSATGNNLIFGNSTTPETMRLDASGNLGLGVTPRTTTGAYTAFEFGQSGYLAAVAAGAGVGLASNAYLASGAVWTYSTTGAATYYSTDSGFHRWFTAPSGTAGNAISFSQVMTLDASGNLGVGTTSPQRSLHINGSVGAMRLQGGSVGGYIEIVGPTTTNYIGTPAAISSGSTTDLGFYLNGTERARITSGGDLLVGDTASSFTSRMEVTQTGVTPVAMFRKNNSNIDPAISVWHGGATGAATATQISFLNSGSSQVGSITSTTSATAYNTSSDYRLKDNPQPLTNSGAFIDALQPKTWEWKVDGSRGVGFIAHEAQAVSPNTVTGQKDAVDAEGKPIMQAMEYGSAEFIANIIAELQSLRARVAALESN